MNKPIHIVRSSLPSIEEYMEKIRPLWESVWLTNTGKLHNELQDKLKERFDVPNLLLFSSGHAALEAAIDVMELTGEVITTPFTFASTTHAIVRAGLKPVFCDIKMDDYNIDSEKIEALITPQTSAIIAVHVYGTPCDVTRIEEIANKYALKVIYDGAHCFHVKLNGIGIGNFGDAMMCSFHATKVYHTIEGGALMFKNQMYEHRLKCIRNFGYSANGEVEEIGANYKMSEFHAAMGLCNLEHIDEEIRKRRAIFELYENRLSDCSWLQLLPCPNELQRNYLYCPVLFSNELIRVKAEEALEAINVHPRKYFSPLTCDFPCYKETYGNLELPIARYIADRILALPLYADLELADVERICTIIRKLNV